ncbi:MAG: ImmA/IrrE family metallo-endopeptidase [Chloroherpetonaceae bacterium]|nr:ImmA/IrrE family metallo-endopeptidase [Chloroherpetonaceae bacterium]
MKTFSVDTTISRADEIAELAEFIAEEYGSNGRVDLLSIARQKNITHSFGYYKNAFNGMLEYYNKRFHIYCNLSRVGRYDSARARFTIAHELGHYFIDEHRNALQSGFAPAHLSVCEYESDNLVEREADWFASNLLMPKPYFTKVAQESSLGMKGILALQQHFQTSVTSTALRYAQVGIVPCLVMKWTFPQGLVWLRASHHEFLAELPPPISVANKLPENSPTLWALMGARMPAEGFFSAQVTAGIWFPSLRDTALRDAGCIEQAIRLGQFGVITLLYFTE